MTRNIFTLRKSPPPPHTHTFPHGKHRLKYIPSSFFASTTHEQKFLGLQQKSNVHPKSVATSHPHPSDLYLMNFEWIPSSTVQPASFIKERHHNPRTRDGFHQGQLAACYTWQERRGMPVDDRIHNTVAILLFQTLLSHSVEAGFQRIRCTALQSPYRIFQVPGEDSRAS